MEERQPGLYSLPWQADISLRFSHFHHAPGAVLLDSGQPASAAPARFDIASAWPLQQISPHAKETSTDFLERARQLLRQLPADGSTRHDQLPFTGGLLGYLSYHFGQPASRHPRTLPGARVGLYDWALINDHQHQRSWLFCHGSMAHERRQFLLQMLQTQQQPVSSRFRLLKCFQPLISAEKYRQGIEQVQAEIRAGTCFQVNFTQRFDTLYEGDPWTAYRVLRQHCPTPYAGFVRLGPQDAILSASPERFLGIINGQLEARPIKGTRRRGHTREEDRALAAELLASAKDRAENLMIVELQAAELAPLCTDVSTPQLAQLESYPNVHHLVSCVQGRLKPGTDALNVVDQCFPGASISGTPKQPVVRLIDQLEACSREIYCGSLFYLDKRGRFDSSICIRTLLAVNGNIHCWGGGGITLASEWQAEYQESVDKVNLLMQSLQAMHNLPVRNGD